MNRKTLTISFAAMAMLVLIFDGQAALSGCAEGIQLCLTAVIPSLFPFVFLSAILTGIPVKVRFLSPLAKVCHIPAGAESLLVAGFFGGYPVGAQSIAVQYREGHLKKPQAERLLAFCSNAGPAFFFGMLQPLFRNKILCWVLWGIHIISAMLVGILMPNPTEAKTNVLPSDRSFSEALQIAVRAMATVCGWVVLFRMLLLFLQRWFLWMLPQPVQVLFSGLLELTNGCILLQTIDSEAFRFCAAACLTAFGGICVTMQTASVIQGLSLRSYIWGKLLQTFISLLLSAGIGRILFPSKRSAPLLWGCAAVCLLIGGCIWGILKNRGSNQLSIGV